MDKQCVNCSPDISVLRIRWQWQAVWTIKAQWLLYVPTGLTLKILRSAHTVYLCFVWIWEQTAIISLYNINWQVFITETRCVYCAVRTGYLYIIHILPWLRRLVAGLSRRRSVFDNRSVHVTFVVDKVDLERVSLRVFRFSPAKWAKPGNLPQIDAISDVSEY